MGGLDGPGVNPEGFLLFDGKVISERSGLASRRLKPVSPSCNESKGGRDIAAI